ncbi:hypothetical protein BBB54_24050 [Klebsiella variicola]|nr:hypothetical protein BBB54_24050 [Klebsiella variicola]
MKSPSCRMGFLRFSGPATVPVCLPGGAALTGATDSHPPCTTCSPDKVRSTASGEAPCLRASSCDVNLSLLQPAAHVSNSITDTVAPDRPSQNALSR